jgi:hypothetical protein
MKKMSGGMARAMIWGSVCAALPAMAQPATENIIVTGTRLSGCEGFLIPAQLTIRAGTLCRESSPNHITDRLGLIDHRLADRVAPASPQH